MNPLERKICIGNREIVFTPNLNDKGEMFLKISESTITKNGKVNTRCINIKGDELEGFSKIAILAIDDVIQLKKTMLRDGHTKKIREGYQLIERIEKLQAARKQSHNNPQIER